MASVPAGRSFSARRESELGSPPQTISEASANVLGPRRCDGDVGRIELDAQREQLAALQQLPDVRADPPSAARASTRLSSLERNSNWSKYSSGPYQRKAGETCANAM